MEVSHAASRGHQNRGPIQPAVRLPEPAVLSRAQKPGHLKVLGDAGVLGGTVAEYVLLDPARVSGPVEL